MSGFASGERDAATLRVIEELKRLYKSKIQPVEELYKYDSFNSPCISDAEFDSKPQVMLIGQYSVGKTTFIRYLLGRDFPSMSIGPEPTTDRFLALMDGPEERTIYGNSLSVMADQPYRGLQRFGNNFLQRFEGVQMPNPVLRNITLIDTPGVLSGEKQRLARGYDFCQVCAWFASRADLIILLFDAHKLDISDEFKNTIDSLKGNDDKIRCILNKADQVDRQKLMRVYGALMWSIGKVIKTPEVMRVYIGSFWDQPLQCDDNAALFEMEERDLMRDLKDLPRNSAVRKINELVKRVRACKVHAYIIAYLREQMPMFYGQNKKQVSLIDGLKEVFKSVLRKYNLAPGDFPDFDDFRNKLRDHDFSKFPNLKPKMIDEIDQVMGVDFPRLMEALPRPQFVEESVFSDSQPEVPLVYSPNEYGGVPIESDNPWSTDNGNGNGNGSPAVWALQSYVEQFAPLFNRVAQNGLVYGEGARSVMMESGLQKPQLSQIWSMADIVKGGGRSNKLDQEEFTIAFHLITMAKNGEPLPTVLPADWIPLSKR
jgi:GTPase SAR1 family protein